MEFGCTLSAHGINRMGTNQVPHLRFGAFELHLSAGELRKNGRRIRLQEHSFRILVLLLTHAGEVVTRDQLRNGRAVAGRISLALSPEMNARLARAKAANPRAYDAYLRGRHFLWDEERTPAHIHKAASYFQEAVAADAGYAAAYAGLAEVYSAGAQVADGPPEQNIREAKKYAAKALELDANQADAHAVLAFFATAYDRDWKGARREFLKTLELDPGSTRARTLYCVYLLAVGEQEEALAEIRRAQELDPLSPAVRSQVVRTLYLARAYGKAIEESQKNLELKPDSLFTIEILAQAYQQLGRYREAMQVLDRLEALPSGDPELLAARGHLLAVAGRHAESRKVLNDLLKLGERGFPVSYAMAVVCAGLGANDEALGWLERAYRLNDPYFNLRLKTDPKLDSLRADSRFQDLLRRMNYPS
jgi:tetratricopeptide (TPR) repeat protein